MNSTEVLLQSPAAEPLPGVTADFDNPPNHRTECIALLTVCNVVCTVLFFIRGYTRLYIVRRVTLEDLFVVLGWGMFIGHTVSLILYVEVSPGLDQWNMRPDRFLKVLYYIYVSSILNRFLMFFIKFAILLQYIELFAPARVNRKMYWACHGLLWTNILFYVTEVFVEIFRCHPIAKAWNLLITEGSCPVDFLILTVVAACINLASDIIILIMPQVCIWKLQMERKQKTLISILFFIAIFACISSSLRLQFSIRVLRNPVNYTYHGFLTGVWSLLEATSAFAVACFPVLPKFLRNRRDKLRLNESSIWRRFTLSGIVSTKSSSGRDRLFDKNANTLSPDSAKSICSQGWHELEDPRSMSKHIRSAEQLYESHRSTEEFAAGDESVV
ncbi:hypothetical protein EYB26_009516 [Talaromyces marneffei]|uniref:uncharacterized protein n=1 Tax=Talaromyces marneffei TaxID=37727 RepID=UPI0012A99D54|nr:uncharacterized protein EYB26_009516 [Talaromyces marneffei]QGA21805.1 hypothetical protein EYB26_009516 [Talaromyces marneffei]